MKHWPKFAISFRSVTFTALIMGIYMGITSFQGLPKRDMPAIPVPVAQVITYYPGATALDVETLVTKKLELSFSEINGVDAVTSTSKPGVSIVTVQLVYGTPTKQSWDKLRNKVEEVRSSLPKNIVGPNVNDEFSDTASLLLAVYGGNYSYRQLKDYAKKLRDRLKRLTAVGKAQIFGEQEEVVYLIARRSLTSKDIPSFWKVSNTLKSKNILYPGAKITPQQLQVKLETSGRVKKVEQLGDIVLNQNRATGRVVRVKDLFEIRRTYKTPTVLVRHKGQRALIVAITMRDKENVIKLGASIDKAMPGLRAALPRALKIEKVTDQPTMVGKSISNFMVNLLQSIGIVLLVAILFMGLRSGLIMAVAIPLSMLLAFIVMKWIGWDLQQMSIAGLIIALGMLVDNAIVITDNIYAKLEEGQGRFEAAWRGASELTMPVLMSTLSTVAVFLPLGMMPSISGDFIRSIPVVVGIVLLSSFLVAMTITPLLSFYLLKIKPRAAAKEEQPGIFMRIYNPVLEMSTARPKRTLMFVLGVFFLAMIGFGLVGKEFFPKAERDMFVVDVWLPEGRTLQATQKAVELIEKQLKGEKDIKLFTAFLGQGAPRFDLGVSPEARSENYAQVVVRTKSDEATARLAPKLQLQFNKTIPEARITVKEFQRGPGVGAPVQLRVYGDDLQALRKLSSSIKALVRKIPGTYDVTDTAGYRIFNVNVNVDDYRASLTGLNQLTVAKVLKALIEGYGAGSIIEGDDEIPIMIRARSLVQKRLGILQNAAIPISAEQSTAVASSLAVAKLTPRWDDARIDRRNNQRYVVVSSYLENGVLAASVLQRLAPMLKKLDVPVGYRLETAGSEEKRSEGFKDLLNAMILGIMLIIGLLVLQFNSFRHAAVILATLPLSLIGAIFGLFITGNAFGFMAFLGLVSLCGVVVNNALVLLDYVQVRLREGSDYLTALREAGIRRMRPILLTTMTTVGGLIPLFLTGGAMWTAMAAVLIFGLLVSTVLTLIVVPCMYIFIVGDREQRQIQQPSAEA